MSDHVKEQPPKVRNWVNADKDQELQWWSGKFGADTEHVKTAVRKVGHSVFAVAKELGTPVPDNLWRP